MSKREPVRMGGCSRTSFSLLSDLFMTASYPLLHVLLVGSFSLCLPIYQTPSMPPKSGFRKGNLVLLQPLFCSVVKPLSSILHLEDEFSTSWASWQGISAHLFGIYRWWELRALFLVSSHQYLVQSHQYFALSMGQSLAEASKDFIFLAHRSAVIWENRFLHKHQSAAILPLYCEPQKLLVIQKGTLPFSSSCGSSVSLQGKSGCFLSSHHLATDCIKQNQRFILSELQTKDKLVRRNGREDDSLKNKVSEKPKLLVHSGLWSWRVFILISSHLG